MPILRQRFSPEETQTLQGSLAEECGEPFTSLGAGELCRTFPGPRRLIDSSLECLPCSTAEIIRAAAQVVAAARPNAPPDDLLLQLRAIQAGASPARGSLEALEGVRRSAPHGSGE